MELGTDIRTDWSLDENGDLNLVNDEDNLVQAIVNRLNCYKPRFEVYYYFYGGFLDEYLGRRRTPETLKFMKIEIDTILSQETRLSSFESSLEYTDNGVRVDLLLNSNDDSVDLNLIIDKDGVSVAS